MNLSLRLLTISTAVAVAILPAAAVAHDFFLLPPAAGARTGIVATIGSTFPKPEIAIATDRVATARAATAAGPVDVRLGAASGDALPVTVAGTSQPVIVSLTLKPRDVEYRDDRIDLIMDEYPVGASAKAAVAALPRPRLLKVDSRRFAKTAVCPDRCTGLQGIAAQGLELEFVAAADGRFRLLADGKPVANHEAVVATVDGKRRHVVTDPRGELTVPADAAGPTMLFASTMSAPSTPNGHFLLRLTSFTVDLR